jgi:ATP-dependent Clp protease protease subunit
MSSISIFDEMTDDEFFSDKLTHIYFNEDVSEESVLKLQKQIMEANKTVIVNDIQLAPKPIIIHISSRGGDMYAGIRFLTIFKESRVPICTLIDNYAASAATYLAINSPYRIITEQGFVLIHQHSAFIYGKREQLLNKVKRIEEIADLRYNLYENKTKIAKTELDELMKHDLWLDAKKCLEKGIVDRILKPIEKKIKNSKEYNYPFNILVKKTNLNNVYISCSGAKEIFDAILREKDNIKPLLIYPQGETCSFAGEVAPIAPHYSVFTDGLSLIPRIQSLKTQSYCIINTTISLDDFIPMLYCTKKYMYSHLSIICNMIYYRTFELLPNDTVENTKTIFELIKNILKEKTKIPQKTINNIDKEMIIFNAKDCLKYGLCDEIIEY